MSLSAARAMQQHGARTQLDGQYTPRLTEALSTTSSCTRLAVWIISVISASRLCLGWMSLQHRSVSTRQKNVAAAAAGNWASPHAGKLCCGARHQQHNRWAQLLAARPEYLLGCGHEQGMPLANYGPQVAGQDVHVLSDRLQNLG